MTRLSGSSARGATRPRCSSSSWSSSRPSPPRSSSTTQSWCPRRAGHPCAQAQELGDGGMALEPRQPSGASRVHRRGAQGGTLLGPERRAAASPLRARGRRRPTGSTNARYRAWKSERHARARSPSERFSGGVRRVSRPRPSRSRSRWRCRSIGRGSSPAGVPVSGRVHAHSDGEGAGARRRGSGRWAAGGVSQHTKPAWWRSSGQQRLWVELPTTANVQPATGGHRGEDH
jgi:hypothetical protein